MATYSPSKTGLFSGSLCTYFIGVEPTPELPVIAIWLALCDILRRRQQPFIYNYEVPPNITMRDHGRVIRYRVDKQNALCQTNGILWKRRNLFQTPSPGELARGDVWVVNLMDPLSSLLPQGCSIQ